LNHGVGYSERRDTQRLGETGAPAARYYVPALRAFQSRASAQPVLDSLPLDLMCSCAVCDRVKQGGIPVVDSLTTEDLKRHFLLCRADEIGRVTADVRTELTSLRYVADCLDVTPALRSMTPGAASRLRLWADAVGRLLPGT